MAAGGGRFAWSRWSIRISVGAQLIVVSNRKTRVQVLLLYNVLTVTVQSNENQLAVPQAETQIPVERGTQLIHVRSESCNARMLTDSCRGRDIIIGSVGEQ